MLSGGHTPPSVMPIDSPHGSASGGNENSSGAPPPQGPLGQPSGCRHRTALRAHHSRMLHVLACLPILKPNRGDEARGGEGTGRHAPCWHTQRRHRAHGRSTRGGGACPRRGDEARQGCPNDRHSSHTPRLPLGGSRAPPACTGQSHTRPPFPLRSGCCSCAKGGPKLTTRCVLALLSPLASSSPLLRSSFGCSVNLPLGSRPVDPHSTAVGCGNLLHSSPQPHTAGLFGTLLFTRWSTRYCNQDLLRKTLEPGSTPAGAAVSHALSTRRCSAEAATATVDCEGASLTWAPSIFGAARFGR